MEILLQKKHGLLNGTKVFLSVSTVWAGLAFRLNADNYQKTGKFLREELAPKGYETRESLMSIWMLAGIRFRKKFLLPE